MLNSVRRQVARDRGVYSISALARRGRSSAGGKTQSLLRLIQVLGVIMLLLGAPRLAQAEPPSGSSRSDSKSIATTTESDAQDPLIEIERARAGGDLREIVRAEAVLALLTAAGDPDRGAELLAAALEGAKLAKLSGLVPTLTLDLGSLRAKAKDFEAAGDLFDEAHSAAVVVGDVEIALRALTNGARAWLDAGDPTKAAARLSNALTEAAKQPNEAATRALVLVNLGRIAERLLQDSGSQSKEQLGQAHRAYRDALDTANRTGEERTASFALYRLAALYAHDGQSSEAIELVRRSILRAEGIGEYDTAWRARALLGGWLADAGDSAGAIKSLQAAVDGANDLGVRGAFDQILGPAYIRLVDLLLDRAASDQASPASEVDLRRAQRSMERRRAVELSDYFQDECVDAYQARNLDPSQVSAEALVIYPILLPDRLVLLASANDSIEQLIVPVSRDEVVAQARLLNQKVVRRVTREYERPARQLHRWLVEPALPIAERIRAKTIVFVPTGPLLAIPFAALRDGKTFLIERYAVAVIPSLELTDPQPIGGRDLRVLVAGLSESVQGFAELPSVQDEVTAISSLYDGELLLNQQFSEEALEEMIGSSQFDLIHLATHAQFGADPSDTYVLTYDGRISLDELSSLVGRLRFRDRPLELLTLSACETASGDEKAALGLVGVAVKAGARSALGTLWSVNDVASAKLIKLVYENLRKPGVSRAEALRRAQLALLEDDLFNHPIYWSAFILVSNWL